MKLDKKVRETIFRHHMLRQDDHVLIGLSGGPDSVCLSRVLAGLRDELKLKLSAVYADHGLRPGETAAEVEFCSDFCSDLGIVFIMKSLSDRLKERGKGKNLQEAARELRHEIFAETAEQAGASRIALGHTADDQAETVLMRLIRGSGRKGLSGMQPVRGRIIRPLIETGRAGIEEYLLEHSQNYMVDSSNLKKDYFRNRLRLSFMDELKEVNPSVAEDICRTADILRAEDEYLEVTVTKTLMKLISRKDSGSIQLFLSPLETIQVPILRRVLRRAVEAVEGLRGISFTNIEDIIGLIKNGKAGDRLDLPRGITVVRDYALLIITKEKPVEIGEYRLDVPGELEVGETGMTITAVIEENGGDNETGGNEVVLDAGAVTFPLKVRSRRAGDFFYPLGFGRKKKLQDYFTDEKVSRDRRGCVPIILSGNDIIWIAGYRGDERFRTGEKTEKVLRLKIRTAEERTE